MSFQILNFHVVMLTHLQWLTVDHLLIIFWRKLNSVGFSLPLDSAVEVQLVHVSHQHLYDGITFSDSWEIGGFLSFLKRMSCDPWTATNRQCINEE